MNLFILPGACSFAPHVALHELGFKHEIFKVDKVTGKTSNGRDYASINPNGYVPALELDNGKVLTEVAVILQYLGDQKPESGFVPKWGTPERYDQMQMLNFVSTEVHKGGFNPLFSAKYMIANEEGRAQLVKATKSRLATRLNYAAEILSNRPYLMGKTMTAADVYFLTVIRWSGMVGVDIAPYEPIKAFMARMHERPSVQAAIKMEGLKG